MENDKLFLTHILLATEDAGELYLKTNGELELLSYGKGGIGGSVPQHLYLCSQGTIKEGDYGFDGMEVFKCHNWDKNKKQDSETILAKFSNGEILERKRKDCKLIEFATDRKIYKLKIACHSCKATGYGKDIGEKCKSCKGSGIEYTNGANALPEKAWAMNDIFNKIAGGKEQEVHFLPYFILEYNQKQSAEPILDTEQIIYEEIILKEGVTFTPDGKKQIVKAIERYKDQFTNAKAIDVTKLAIDIQNFYFSGGRSDGHNEKKLVLMINEALRSNAEGFSLDDMLKFGAFVDNYYNQERAKIEVCEMLEEFQILTKPKGDINMYLIDGQIHFK